MIDFMQGQDWLIWGIGLMVGFPLLVLILGELCHRVADNSGLSGPLNLLRHVVLPSLVFLLLMKKVLGYDDTELVVRIAETVFWITVISASLSFFNVVFFENAHENSWQARVPKLLLDLGRLFLVLTGGAIVLSVVWGADLGRLMAALGVGSVVLGLALQDTLGGLFSGISLISGKQFMIGEWIRIGDKEGEVSEISWRSVTLVTREGDLEIIPNAVIAKDSFRNFSRPTARHLERVQFDFSFDDAPHKVKRVLIDAANDTQGILDSPAPAVSLLSYDEFTVKHEIRFFVEDYQRVPVVRDAFISRIWYAAKRHGLTFPTRSHEVYTFDGAQLDSDDTEHDIADRLAMMSPLGIPREALDTLADEALLHHYGVGECLLKQSETSQGIHFILEGSATEKLLDQEQVEKEIRRLNSGDFFGLTSMLRNSPSKTTVLALEDMLVAEFPQATVRRVLNESPDFANELEQLTETQDKAVQKFLPSVDDALGNILKPGSGDKVVSLRTGSMS